MNKITFKRFDDGINGLYGGFVFTAEDEIENAKELLLEQMIDAIRELAKKDEFWIVKLADKNDPLSRPIGLPEDIKAASVAWKIHFPQMEPEKDYKQRMKEEYWQVKSRYNKLHNMCIKYEAGTLDFTPTCSLELLTAQKAAMGKYLHCLEVRAQIEGVVL